MALEKIDGISAVFISKTSTIFLSKEKKLAQTEIETALNPLGIKVLSLSQTE